MPFDVSILQRRTWTQDVKAMENGAVREKNVYPASSLAKEMLLTQKCLVRGEKKPRPRQKVLDLCLNLQSNGKPNKTPAYEQCHHEATASLCGLQSCLPSISSESCLLLEQYCNHWWSHWSSETSPQATWLTLQTPSFTVCSTSHRVPKFSDLGSQDFQSMKNSSPKHFAYLK